MPSRKKVGGTAEAAKKQFPLELFVGREEDGDDFYFIANETIQPFDDTDAVGIYELKDVRRKSVEHTLV